MTDNLSLYDLTGYLDVLLSSHEHEDIAWWQRQMDLQNLLYGTIHVVFTRRFGVEHFNREGTSWYCESRCSAIEVGELSPKC